MVGIDPLAYGRWWVYKHPKLVLELNKVSIEIMKHNFGWHELNGLGILISWLILQVSLTASPYVSSPRVNSALLNLPSLT